jgi:hypothetical protein
MQAREFSLVVRRTAHLAAPGCNAEATESQMPVHAAAGVGVKNLGQFTAGPAGAGQAVLTDAKSLWGECENGKWRNSRTRMVVYVSQPSHRNSMKSLKMGHFPYFPALWDGTSGFFHTPDCKSSIISMVSCVFPMG